MNRRRAPENSEARWGVRRTAVVAAVATTAVALLAGGLLILFFLQRGVLSSAEVSARALSQDLAASYRDHLIIDGQLPRSSVSFGGSTVQVIDPKLQVIASSETDLGRSHATQFPQVGESIVVTPPTWLTLAASDEPVVAATGFATAGQQYAVAVSMPVTVQLGTVATVGVYLLIATPLLVALVGWGTARIVGGALQPVSRIREQVDAITRERLAVRVDVPATDDEVAALAATMNAMLDRLDDADRAQRRFVADASHELRSPIASIGAAVEVLNDEGPAAWSEIGPMIATENSRLARLVDDLLTLAKSEDGDRPLDLRACDLDELISAQVAVLRASTSLTVTTDIAPVQTRCDVPLIRQALRNLLDNAGRFASSSVQVTCHAIDGDAVIDVLNDGPVIPPADRVRIFDRFVRLDDSRSRSGGSSGLGLAIVREHVRSHGGSIEAGESPDGRCVFRMRLPIRSTIIDASGGVT